MTDRVIIYHSRAEADLDKFLYESEYGWIVPMGFLVLVSVVVLFQVLAWIKVLLFSRNIHKQLGHRYRP